MKYKTLKVLWCCERHEMSVEQMVDLKRVLKDSDDIDVAELVVEHIRPRWQVSSDRASDAIVNEQLWVSILEHDFGRGYAAVCGVFPLVAMEALDYHNTHNNFIHQCVYSPVVEMRMVMKNGKQVKQLKHHRWSQLG